MIAYKFKDFEDYLQDRHCVENPTILDDDLPDAYNEWLSELEEDDWIRYANSYAQHKVNQLLEETKEHYEKQAYR